MTETHTGVLPSTQSRTPMDNWVVIVCFVALKGRDTTTVIRKNRSGSERPLPTASYPFGRRYFPLTPKKQRTRLMVRYKKQVLNLGRAVLMRLSQRGRSDEAFDEATRFGVCACVAGIERSMRARNPSGCGSQRKRGWSGWRGLARVRSGQGSTTTAVLKREVL
jgi:hypothetical protein